MALFSNRYDTGQKLAHDLAEFQGRQDVIVLALPRGGVPVGYEVAQFLGSPLDILLVRKLGVPGHEELAMGAIASGGVRVLNRDVVDALNIPPQVIERVAEREQRELERREEAYRGDYFYPSLEGKVVILVDDGLATGASMRAAADAVRLQHPAQIIVAVPTAAEQTCREIAAYTDRVICHTTPEPFMGVGRWYEDFSQTSDEEVRDLLEKANAFSNVSDRNHPQDFRGQR